MSDLTMDENCEVCEAHAKLRQTDAFFLREFPCPTCRFPIQEAEFNLTTVGEHNGREPQIVDPMLVARCPNCDLTVGLHPTPIVYNANHDVHYTLDHHARNHPDASWPGSKIAKDGKPHSLGYAKNGWRHCCFCTYSEYDEPKDRR